ncbi:uncharacterized protein LOC129022837 isoform X1 [Pongo pygmaeus]|uniref:uncharacterized protein LOC129022837 isoform X1 n=1 Tax=Pongo pygmaeus TaxID=9600 RepID=UPI00300C7AB0
MEILDEFDSEVPQRETFCQQISEKDLERQADTYIGRALRHLVRNPSLAERVVLAESAGSLFSGRSSSVLCRGKLNHCNSMGALEMHERVEQLKQSIHGVHLYSRGKDQPLPVLGPGRGLSPVQPGRGLDTKKTRRKPRQKKPEPNLLWDRLTPHVCHQPCCHLCHYQHHGLRGDPISPWHLGLPCLPTAKPFQFNFTSDLEMSKFFTWRIERKSHDKFVGLT